MSEPQATVSDPPMDWTKPLPLPDAVSAPYWSAAAGGKLLIQRCPQCGQKQFYPRALCTACGGDPEWLEASGRGTVHTYTVIRQMGMKPFRDELPYVVAMIELDEGPLIMGSVTGVEVEAVHIGMPVVAEFTRVDESVGIPSWRAKSE